MGSDIRDRLLTVAKTYAHVDDHTAARLPDEARPLLIEAKVRIEAQDRRIAELEAEVLGCQGRLDAAIEDYQDARAKGLEEAARLIDEGFDRQGIAKQRDTCAHGKFGWEDCESCASAAIRALIPEKREG